MQGRVKFHRKITEREWYSDANTFRVFFHLITIANHKDWKRQWIDVKRWQTITGRIELSKKLNLSEMQIRTALDKLERTWEISKKATNRFTLITVLKYCDYNDYDLEDNQQITNKQPTDNQQITTNKNDKNKKEWKEIFFDLFRSEYPNKKSKDKAKELFDKKVKSWINPDILIAWAKKYKLSTIGTDIWYIKHPTTRLNQWCRDDDVTVNIQYIINKYKQEVAKDKDNKATIYKDFTEQYWIEVMKQVLEKINWPSFISNF
jgi:hypothetical protein